MVTIFCCVELTIITLAFADCTDEIDSMLQGGAWDPFSRENRQETTVVKRPDGSETPNSEVLWDGPVRSINCTANRYFMAIGSTTWTGALSEGRWASSNDIRIEDPEEFVRATNARFSDSIDEPECLGDFEIENQNVQGYGFFSKPEPNEYGSWWGGIYSFGLTRARIAFYEFNLSMAFRAGHPLLPKTFQL
jgi:hypothetical protein